MSTRAANIDDGYPWHRCPRLVGNLPSIGAGTKIDIGYKSAQSRTSGREFFQSLVAVARGPDIIAGIAERRFNKMLRKNFILDVKYKRLFNIGHGGAFRNVDCPVGRCAWRGYCVAENAQSRRSCPDRLP